MSASREELLWRIDELRNRVRELESENQQLRDDLDSAEFRIRNDLEPRIRADRRAYDRMALDPERGM